MISQDGTNPEPRESPGEPADAGERLDTTGPMDAATDALGNAVAVDSISPDVEPDDLDADLPDDVLAPTLESAFAGDVADEAALFDEPDDTDPEVVADADATTDTAATEVDSPPADDLPDSYQKHFFDEAEEEEPAEAEMGALNDKPRARPTDTG